MKRLLLQRVMPFCALIIFVVVFSACHSRQSEPVEQNQLQRPIDTPGNTEKKSEPSVDEVQEASFETVSTDEKRVSFAGVSFIYKVSLFPDIRAEIVPALPVECSNCKADEYYPKHIRFCFTGKKTTRDEYPY